jgi:hypothetical protein
MSKELDPFERTMLDPVNLADESVSYYDPDTAEELTEADMAVIETYQQPVLDEESLMREIAAQDPELAEAMGLSLGDDVFPG